MSLRSTSAETSEPAPRRSGRPLPGSLRLVSPLVLLIVWQGLGSCGLLPTHILATPWQVLTSAVRLTQSGELPDGLAVSLLRVLAGFALALVLAVPAALVTGLSRLGDALIDPPIQMLKALPFLGLLPLFILWFGIGEAPKVALVAIGALAPIYLALVGGIRAIDRSFFDVAHVYGLGRRAVIWRLVLPATLPALLMGVRHGLSIAWLSLVVAEQINAMRGIGAILVTARDLLETDVIVVCLVVYALMGLLTDSLVRLLETHLLSWRAPLPT